MVHDSPVGEGTWGWGLQRVGWTQLTLRQDLDLTGTTADRGGSGGEPDAAYVILTTVNTMPRAWLEDRAELARRMSRDAPLGDMVLDEEAWDAERVDALWNTPSPIWAVETVAQHRETGRLVGFTDLLVRPGNPTLAIQSDTLVLREHRGHGLGAGMKAVNLAALREHQPQVRCVRTWNADSNVHMIAINAEMGFVVTGWTREWTAML